MTIPKFDKVLDYILGNVLEVHTSPRQRSAECEDVLGFACSKSGLSGNLLQGAAIPLKGLVEVAFLPLCFVSYI